MIAAHTLSAIIPNDIFLLYCNHYFLHPIDSDILIDIYDACLKSFVLN